MRFILLKLSILTYLFVSTFSLSGKATTTRYCDNTKGACGCGEGMDHWQRTSFTAAASLMEFGPISWCGQGCGRCFRITSEGWSPEGTGGGKGDTIDIMVTNFCPDVGWCAPAPNKFGFMYHFDLMDCHNQIGSKGWDNPVVTFDEIPCTEDQKRNWSSCECFKKSLLK